MPSQFEEPLVVFDNQVLDLSKIEAGKLELSPEPVNLVPLIDDVIGTARQLSEQNKNRLVVEASEDLGVLTVTPCGCRATHFTSLVAKRIERSRGIVV
jgi:signal transduction histidine kinase